jgi:hypothetical protein
VSKRSTSAATRNNNSILTISNSILVKSAILKNHRGLGNAGRND